MYVTPGAKAIAYAGLGDKTRALTALEQAYENRSFAMLILREQYFDSLRGERRFQAIARATGLF